MITHREQCLASGRCLVYSYCAPCGIVSLLSHPASRSWRCIVVHAVMIHQVSGIMPIHRVTSIKRWSATGLIGSTGFIPFVRAWQFIQIASFDLVLTFVLLVIQSEAKMSFTRRVVQQVIMCLICAGTFHGKSRTEFGEHGHGWWSVDAICQPNLVVVFAVCEAYEYAEAPCRACHTSCPPK